jgi:NADH-quinone oxidoreductase subunit M
MASVYMLRMFIRAMHNRVGPEMRSAELSGRDALVLVPLVLSILALAVYPQVALDKSEPAVGAAVEAAR